MPPFPLVHWKLVRCSPELKKRNLYGNMKWHRIGWNEMRTLTIKKATQKQKYKIIKNHNIAQIICKLIYLENYSIIYKFNCLTVIDLQSLTDKIKNGLTDSSSHLIFSLTSMHESHSIHESQTIINEWTKMYMHLSCLWSIMSLSCNALPKVRMWFMHRCYRENEVDEESVEPLVTNRGEHIQCICESRVRLKLPLAFYNF